MALFGILGENLDQGLSNLMDQDWNHWKLQMQSWMDDANEDESKHRPTAGPSSGPSTGGCPGQSCGASSYQRRGCGTRCGPNSRRGGEPTHPLEGLHQLWTQFANARQQQQRSAREEATNNLVKSEQNKYTIKLDVQNFEPNEITVKIVGNDIVVEGEHPERTDRLGRVSRKFQRKYELPDDVEPNTIVSTLTAGGVLIIEGLKKNAPKETGAEIVIPVMREQTDNSSQSETGGDQSSETSNHYQNEQQMD